MSVSFGVIALAVLLTVVAIVDDADAQIPSFGGCPVYEPMLGFDRERFMGTWHEVQRYFTVTELAARCISATYEKHPDDSLWVNNAVTNRFTGVTRLIAGKLKLLGKAGEGKFNVQYNTLPVSYDTTMNVLDTDYESFAVIWSCSGIGPIGHTESAWVMTRDRLPTGVVLQRAYGVLDRFGIRRSFFIETDQQNCDPMAAPVEAYDPTEATGSRA